MNISRPWLSQKNKEDSAFVDLMKILTFNCGTVKDPEAPLYGLSYVAGLNDFLINLFQEARYDFILLQEFHTNTYLELEPRLENYKILRAFDTEGNIDSQLAIAYRKNFILKENKFYSFSGFKKFNVKWPGIFGLLLGTFQTPKGDMIAGSLHLNPLLHFLTRKREVQYSKKCLLACNTRKLPVIFGGDFNSALPGEKNSNNTIFVPEFVNVTLDSGPTVDSRYVEPVVFINKAAALLKKFGLKICMKVDHVYADNKSAKMHAHSCKVLNDRVSDHSPVEVILED